LYRAIDSQYDAIDFMVSPKRDLVAGRQFRQLALWWPGAIRPPMIFVDGQHRLRIENHLADLPESSAQRSREALAPDSA
jgi:transposase-like protein